MKLYTHPSYPDHWIGDIGAGQDLWMWPRERNGWEKRLHWPGPLRGLHPVSPALARGTGAPGTGSGKPSRQPGEPGRGLTFKIDDTRRKRVTAAAKRARQSVNAWLIAMIDRVLEGM